VLGRHTNRAAQVRSGFVAGVIGRTTGTASTTAATDDQDSVVPSLARKSGHIRQFILRLSYTCAANTARSANGIPSGGVLFCRTESLAGIEI